MCGYDASASEPSESALIIVCPEAEPVVGVHRARYDRAAQFGVPAHVTVTYPFKPPSDLAQSDETKIEAALSQSRPFTLRASRTDWFDQSVLFVALEDQSPVLWLTQAMAKAFPAFLPYQGVYDEVVPHLTIGHDQPLDVLKEAEREVWSTLPIVQQVDHVDLWTGPALRGPVIEDSWQRARTYRLG